MRVTLVTRLHCYRLHRFSVSAYQRIIVSAYQCINVPAYQRINVPAYRRSSVPAYWRTSASVYYAAGLQLIKHSAEQRISVEPRPTRIATSLLFSRVCSCSGFCGKWESLAAKRKKKPGKCPKLKIKRIAKKTKQQSPPQKTAALIKQGFCCSWSHAPGASSCSFIGGSTGSSPSYIPASYHLLSHPSASGHDI